MARKKLFLIDGHSHLYRAFFAVKGLTSPEGRPTNAVFGFTAMLRRLLREQKPDYLAVALDMPGKTFRHDLFEDYKATRVKPPDEFIAQIPLTREVLDALQVPVYALEGYEADDVLGTLAVQAAGLGVDVVIVTGDKDAAQLLGPNVSVLDTGKDQTLTAEKLRERDGIAPEQVIEVMALSGDASDNVPGVAHVGPKTALELIREYGTLENVLAHVGEIRGQRLKESLTQHADTARLSRRLVTIDTKAPVELSLDACRVKPPEPERLIPVFQKLGFRQFIAEFPVAPTREEAAAYHLVDTEEALEPLLAALRAQKRFSIDLETTSTSPMLAEIVGLSVSWKPKEAWYIPTRALAPDPTLDTEKVLDALRPILADESVGKIGQNIKYDAVVLRRHGVELRGIVFDTMIAAYVLDAERRRYGLDELAADYLSYRMIPITDLIGKGKKQITMDRVPARKVCDYCCADSDIALRLSEILEKLLREQKMHDLFAQVEMPLVSVLAEMEFQGIGLDVAALRTMSQWLEQEMAKLEKQIYQEAGEEFNIGSTQQLAKILFEKLRLPRGRKTRTGSSTDSDVLDQLSAGHRLPALVLEYRQLSKLKSTYADALPEMVAPGTHRLHTSFNQAATATGRLSSSDPNLQNIPIRSEIGERIRKAFVASRPAQPAADRRLLADRAAHPRAPQRRCGAARGVRAGCGHPSLRRRADSRRQARRSHPRDAARGQDDQFRHHLRPGPVRPGSPVENPERGSRRVHRGLLPALSGREGVHRPNHRRSAEERRRDHAPRPPPAAAGPERPRPRHPRLRRARRGQHRHPGHRRRHDQGGHDPHRPPPAPGEDAHPDAAPDSRRTPFRGAARRGDQRDRPGLHGDEHRAEDGRAGQSERGPGPNVERSEIACPSIP